MTFLRASEKNNDSRLRRVITATLASLAVYSLAIINITPAQAQSGRKGYIKAETAYMRSGPGTSHKTKALLDAGRKAKVVGKKGEWLKVRLDSGTEGWIRSDLMAVSKKKSSETKSSSKKASSRRRRSSDEDDDKPRRTASRRSRSEDRDEAPKRRKTTRTAKAKPAPVRKAKPIYVAKAKPKPVVKAAPKPVTVAIKRPAPSLAKPRPTIKPVSKSFVKPPLAEATRVLVPKPVIARPVIAKPGDKVLTVTIQPAVKSAPKNPVKVEPKPLPELEETKPVAEEQPQTEPPTTPPTGEPISEVISVKAPVQVAQAKPTINRASTRSTPSRSSRLINKALSYRGTPYRRGATGRGAFDCSGFMVHLFKQMGQMLPRTAAEQYHVGAPVHRTKLQPGDLVFFKNTYKRGVSHVGLFIGNGKFVHASSHGGVRTNSLSDSYYLNHWAGARRPTGKK